MASKKKRKKKEYNFFFIYLLFLFLFFFLFFIPGPAWESLPWPGRGLKKKKNRETKGSRGRRPKTKGVTGHAEG
jgi:hypothetical protein